MPQKKQQQSGWGNPSITEQTPSTPQPIITPSAGGWGNFEPQPYEPPVTTPAPGFVNTVLSTVSPVLDVLSRGQYASAKFFDSAAYEGKGIFQSLGLAFNEAIDPKERLSFSDVIKKNYKQFAEENPKATTILGFLGDVALDPTTYLGVGLVKEGIQIGGKTLSKAGLRSLKIAEEAIEATGKARFAEKKIAENVNLIRVLDMADDYPAQKAFYLKELGFTDEVARRAQQYDSLAGGKLAPHESYQLAEQELTKEVRENYYKGLVDDLSTGEVRERAEQRIMRIAEALPEFKSFEKKGLRLTIGVPFGKQYDPLNTAKVFDVLGVNRLGENIAHIASKIPGAKFANQVFNKYAGVGEVPNEFVDNLRQIENTKDSLIQGVLRDVKTLGDGITQEGSAKIQDAMYKIDDASRELEDQLGRGLTQAEADKIKMDGLQAARLSPQEHALVASLYQGYAQMGELEMRANLLRSSLANYTHREYEAIKDATQAGNILRPPNAQGTNTFLGSSQARDYRTIAEAKAAGKVPEMDALTIYAQRLIKHRDKMANAQFNDATRRAFGLDTSTYGKQLTNEEFQQLPTFARNSIKMLGDAVYPSGMSEAGAQFLRFVDATQALWKKGAYAIKPSSAPKQLIGNTVLASLVAGARTFKAFDPRAMVDAALAVSSKLIPEKALPKSIKDIIARGFGGDAEFAERVALRNFRNSNDLNNYFDGVTIKSVLGTSWKGSEVYKDMLDKGVIKGFDASGEALKTKVNNALSRNPDSIGTVAGELAKVWNWPSYAEDFSRASLYINGLRMGYSPTEAVKLVNKGLFDYARGLSSIEKNVFKRLLPFYTFPRFAIPAVLRTVTNKPGNAVTTDKFVKLIGKMFNGEGMTPAEQESIPGYILEQPRIYTGFDKEGKAGFNVFNSLTPYDAISLLVRKRDGGIDYSRSVEKSILAAVTPFLKVPLELKFNKNFFTGRTLDEAGKLKGVDDSSKMNAVLPQFVKDAIGWEVRTTPKGGTQVYVNPYFAHTMGSAIPGIKSYVNLGDGTQSHLERSMNLIFGIQKVKVDLKEQSDWNALKDQKELTDIKARMKAAQLKGSENEFEKAFRDYNEFIRAIDIKQGLEGQNNIRGTGLNTANPTEPGSPTTSTFK